MLLLISARIQTNIASYTYVCLFIRYLNGIYMHS